MQRQMLGDMLKITDVSVLDKVMKMFAEGLMPSTADLATGQDQATQAVLETGRAVVDQTIGPLEQSLNRFSAVGVKAIDNMHARFLELGKAVEGFGQNIVGKLVAALEPTDENKRKRKSKDQPATVAGAKQVEDSAGTSGIGAATEQAFRRGRGMEVFEDVGFQMGRGGRTIQELEGTLQGGLKPFQPDAGPMRLPLPRLTMPTGSPSQSPSVSNQQLRFDIEPIELMFKIDATTEGVQLRPMIGEVVQKVFPIWDKKAQRLSNDQVRDGP